MTPWTLEDVRWIIGAIIGGIWWLMLIFKIGDVEEKLDKLLESAPQPEAGKEKS